MDESGARPPASPPLGMVTVALLALLQLPMGRVVSITIDDLPATGQDWPAITTGLLAALAHHNAPAIGFVNERKLYVDGTLDSSRVALLSAWLTKGHELGNHTFAHRSAHATPLAEYLEGIVQGERVTLTLRSPSPDSRRGGQGVRYFRHPQLRTGRTLAYRDSVNRFLAAHGYRVAPVTVDNQEWLYARAYEVARQRRDSALTRRVVADYFEHMDSAFSYSESLSRRLFDREIPLVLLLHANQLNADHLDALLQRLTTRGYRFVTLDIPLADAAYQSRDTYTGPIGPSWLTRWALTRGIEPPPEPREHEYIRNLTN
jgi:peptidoglycan/xylan/chitin deacetylase (PgdA/CDA1 family)